LDFYGTGFISVFHQQPCLEFKARHNFFLAYDARTEGCMFSPRSIDMYLLVATITRCRVGGALDAACSHQEEQRFNFLTVFVTGFIKHPRGDDNPNKLSLLKINLLILIN